jgi:hypothetical protein
LKLIEYFRIAIGISLSAILIVYSLV